MYHYKETKNKIVPKISFIGALERAWMARIHSLYGENQVFTQKLDNHLAMLEVLLDVSYTK